MIEGTGRLTTTDRLDLGRVSYQLSVDDRGPLNEASGILFADPDVIGYAFTADDTVRLVRENGKAIKIVITNVIATNEAEFRVSGSPGPM